MAEDIGEAQRKIVEAYREAAYRYFTVLCLNLTLCSKCRNMVSIDIDGNVHCMKYPGGDVKARISCRKYEGEGNA